MPAWAKLEARAFASTLAAGRHRELDHETRSAGRGCPRRTSSGENLLHIENRTRFPNLQEAAGSYNAKRQYLAGSVADRAGTGPRGWRSVTHVMACLWSAEVLHEVRLRRATFGALCPDPPDALHAWLERLNPRRPAPPAP